MQEEAIDIMTPPLEANGLWYASRHWINVIPGIVTFTAESFNCIGANKVFSIMPIPPVLPWRQTWTT
jgi:hypothetical protein